LATEIYRKLIEKQEFYSETMKTGDKVNPNLDKQNQYLKFARLNKESTDDELKDAKKILEQLKIEIPQEEK
jgi:hypothetical protein